MSDRCCQCERPAAYPGASFCDQCKSLLAARSAQHAACVELVEYDDDAYPIAEDDGKPYGLHSAQVNEDFAVLFKTMLDATREVMKETDGE